MYTKSELCFETYICQIAHVLQDVPWENIAPEASMDA